MIKKTLSMIMTLIMMLSVLSSCSLLFDGDEKKKETKETTAPIIQTTPELTTPVQTTEPPAKTQPDDEFKIIAIDPIQVGETKKFEEPTVFYYWGSINTTVYALECYRPDENSLYFKTQADGVTPFDSGAPYICYHRNWIIDMKNLVFFHDITHKKTDEYSEYDVLMEVTGDYTDHRKYLAELVKETLGDDYDEDKWYIVHNGVFYDSKDYEVITDIEAHKAKYGL